MASASPHELPKLLYFFSETSGPSRRIEGHLSQILQERGNHHAFALSRIDVDRFPDLAERFCVTRLPTIIVLEGCSVRVRLDKATATMGAGAIRAALIPWLR